MTWYNPLSWLGDSESDEPETNCDHPTFASGDNEYWYEYLHAEPDRTYWASRDNTYVKLQPTLTLYVCRYCGKAKVISSPEEVGGPEGIIRNEDIRQGIHEKPDANVGGWKNVNEADTDPITAKVEYFHELKRSEEDDTERPVPMKYEKILEAYENDVPLSEVE